jgi:hypothetical protein
VSLAEKLKTHEVSASIFTNSVDRWLDTLDGDERDAAEKILRDPKMWSLREMRWAFRDEGFRVAAATLSEWRKANGVS